ncbi:NUDIX domain-containing protein [Patescibacteria group bacterium]
MDKKIEVTATALLRKKDNNIFLHQSPKWQDKWVAPGGRLNYGETIVAGVKRETKEETGYEINPLSIVNVIGSINPPKYNRPAHFIHIHFLCELIGGNYRPDKKEVINGRWFSIEDALEITDGSMRKSILNLKEGKYLDIVDLDSI